MYIKHAGHSEFMCVVRSGVLQGCPLAALLFVLAMDPFLIIFKNAVDNQAIGIVRACADDIAVVLRSFFDFPVIFKIFQLAADVAGLVLKPTKCFVVPLFAPFSDAVVKLIRDFLASQLPAWLEFQIVPTAEYLGIWLGPAAGTKNWVTQNGKWRERIN
eukprot:5332368-Karenia_brevis.AAC.1